MSSDVREYLIVNYEYGVYRVKLTAYGNTTQGREFILDVPEYSFLTEEPEPVVVAVEPNGVDPSLADNASAQSALPEQKIPLVDEKMSTSTLVSLVVSINLFLLIVGGGLIWWLTLENKPDYKFMKRFKHFVVAKNPLSFLTKMFKRKPKGTTAEKKPQAKDKSDPGFMDLSLPKE